MRIKVIQVGKTKDLYIQEGVDEFVKRLGPYAKIETITVKDEAKIKLDESDFIVVLDERGREMTSTEFSKFVEGHKDSGQTICFVIGGAYGLPQNIKDDADAVLSMSKMTFTHQMIRLFLMEQLYRAVCIFSGKEYHND